MALLPHQACCPAVAVRPHDSALQLQRHLSHTPRHPHSTRKVASHTGSEATTSSQHRRRTSRGLHVPPEGLRPSSYSSSGLSPTRASFGTTTYIEEEDDGSYSHMSLDRSPSPQHGGGWSSPGLTTPYDEANGRARSPIGAGKSYGNLNGGVTWASAKANSARVNGYPSYQSQNQGFFGRHYRKISQGLPYFAHGGQEDRYAEKEKLGRGRSGGYAPTRSGSLVESLGELPRRIGLLLSRRRKFVALLLMLLFVVLAWFHKRM